MGKIIIRTIDPKSKSEIELVAQRMRLTLVDVLGKSVGESMYSMDWLIDRVLFHLDPTKSTAQIFLSENIDSQITGHCIVRVEQDSEGSKYGLFSTTYVAPEFRNQGIANDLLLNGENWIQQQGLLMAITYTSDSNNKLINLYKKHGYSIYLSDKEKHMVGLRKCFTTGI